MRQGHIYRYCNKCGWAYPKSVCGGCGDAIRARKACACGSIETKAPMKCHRVVGTLADGKKVRCGEKGSSWAYRIDVSLPGERNEDGTRKRTQRFKGGFAKSGDARAALHKLQDDIAKDKVVDPSEITVGDFLDQWLASRRSDMKPSALETARIHIKAHIRPALGGVRLQTLNATAVKKFYADLTMKKKANDKPLSPKTVHNVHLTLRSALEAATEDHIVERNVAAKAHRSPKAPDERETWTEEQLRTFLAYASGDRLFPLWRTASTTGARRGELAALRWPNVDLDRGTVTINLNRTKGESIIDPETDKVQRTIVEVTPKSARSRRTIDIGPETIRVLREHKARQNQERFAFGREGYGSREYVFARQDGEPYDPEILTDHFERLVRRTKLPRVGMHAAFRHLHGSVLLRDGVPLHVVSRRLGHANEAFTARVYAHVLPGQQAHAAATFEAAIDG